MNDAVLARLKELVRDVPDFPKSGITFKDITPVLADSAAFHSAVDLLAAPFANAGVTAVLGIESRGFMFAAPVALRLNAAFIPVRKPGKLPRAVHRVAYALEYGNDALEIHQDALLPDARVLIVDDVIATGGTARATLDLVRGLGATVVGAAFFIELAFLGGVQQLEAVRVVSALRYGGSST